MSLDFNYSKNTARTGISLYLILSVFFLYLYYPTLINQHISDATFSQCSYILDKGGEVNEKGSYPNVAKHAKCCLSIISEISSVIAEQPVSNLISFKHFKNLKFKNIALQIIRKKPEYSLHAARAPPAA